MVEEKFQCHDNMEHLSAMDSEIMGRQQENNRNRKTFQEMLLQRELDTHLRKQKGHDMSKKSSLKCFF